MVRYWLHCLYYMYGLYIRHVIPLRWTQDIFGYAIGKLCMNYAGALPCFLYNKQLPFCYIWLPVYAFGFQGEIPLYRSPMWSWHSTSLHCTNCIICSADVHQYLTYQFAFPCQNYDSISCQVKKVSYIMIWEKHMEILSAWYEMELVICLSFHRPSFVFSPSRVPSISNTFKLIVIV